MSIRSTVLVVSALILVPAVARAQDAPVTAGWKDGFFVQSADGDNRMNLGATLQVDSRAVSGDPTPGGNTFTIRKARINIIGRIAKYFDFRLQPDFGAGTATLPDGWLEIRFSRAFRVRSGKDKTPVGYELLVADPWVLFAERSLASSLVPNRDVGLQVMGDVSKGRVAYVAGAFNGVPDGASSSTDVDTDGGKELAGRVVLQPFAGRAPAVSGLGFHFGGSRSHETGGLPTFKTTGGRTWFYYDRGDVAAGEHTRVTPAAFYTYKRSWTFAEYVRSTQMVARGSTTSAISNRAWDVTSAYVLTGEPTSSETRGVHPAKPFDPPSGRWGAVQVVARCAQLAVDRRAFDAGLASTGVPHEARQFTVGVDWYPAAPIKYYFDVDRTTFVSSSPADVLHAGETTVLFRAQVAF